MVKKISAFSPPPPDSHQGLCLDPAGSSAPRSSFRRLALCALAIVPPSANPGSGTARVCRSLEMFTLMRYQCRIRLWSPGALRKMRPPKTQLGGLWGSAVSSLPPAGPSGVWGEAPAEIEFGVL